MSGYYVANTMTGDAVTVEFPHYDSAEWACRTLNAEEWGSRYGVYREGNRVHPMGDDE